jgi:hypothetical protein
VYKGFARPPAVLRAYLAGAFDDVESVTHGKTGETAQFTASKRWLAGSKMMTGHILVPAVSEFAAFGRCTIATAFGVEHPLLDQFIKETGLKRQPGKAHHPTLCYCQHHPSAISPLLLLLWLDPGSCAATGTGVQRGCLTTRCATSLLGWRV